MKNFKNLTTYMVIVLCLTVAKVATAQWSMGAGYSTAILNVDVPEGMQMSSNNGNIYSVDIANKKGQSLVEYTLLYSPTLSQNGVVQIKNFVSVGLTYKTLLIQGCDCDFNRFSPYIGGGVGAMGSGDITNFIVADIPDTGFAVVPEVHLDTGLMYETESFMFQVFVKPMVGLTDTLDRNKPTNSKLNDWLFTYGVKLAYKFGSSSGSHTGNNY